MAAGPNETLDCSDYPGEQDPRPEDHPEKILYLTDYPDENWVRVSFYMEQDMLDAIRVMAGKASKSEGAVIRKFIEGGMQVFMDILQQVVKENSDAT